MSDQDKQAAKEHAARAARQVKHAANNAGEAAEAGAEFVKDEVIETAEKGKRGAQDLLRKAVKNETGRGMIAIGLGVISVVYGVEKVQSARKLSKALGEG